MADIAIPNAVTARQARKALNQLGLRVAVESWIEGQPQDIQDEWYYADPILRSNGAISAGATALSITEEELDQIFVLAATF